MGVPKSHQVLLPLPEGAFFKCGTYLTCACMNIEQLLDEVGHDITNYQNRVL